MSYSNDECFECGELGHFAANCPNRPRPGPAHYGWDPYAKRRSREVQERINARGGMKVRAALAGHWELFDRIDSIRAGDADEAECTAALASLGC